MRPTRVTHLLERFGSVRNVFKARLESLEAVDGIGTATARKIHWAISEAQASYGGDAAMLFEL